MATKSAHGPTPWQTKENNHVGLVGPLGASMSLRIIWDDNKTDVAYAYTNEDAATIVRAVNAHEELVATLKSINLRDVDFKTRERIANAIAKAEGK